MHEVHSEFLKFAKKNSDKKRAVQEKKYLYSDLKHYGLSVAVFSKFTKPRKKEFLALDKKEVIELAKELWRSPSYEERSLALHLLKLHKEKLTKSDMPFIEKIMRGSKGWALLDNSIIPLMPGLLEKHQELYKSLENWNGDEDFWVRRSAMLAQLLFFRNGAGGDKDLFFEFARSQFNETWINEKYDNNPLLKKRAKFFIRKAIGWTLREMSEKDPDIVVKFLNENKEKMSGLSYREGSRNLPPKYKIKLK